MKAFILAAGHGTRLRPLTDRTPKCLLPIRGKPILEIWLELCRAFGIDEVLVNVHSHADQVRKFLSHRASPPQVIVVEEPALLGSAGTLAANRHWLRGEPFFWVFYCDVLTNMDLNLMLQIHRAREPLATLGVYRVPDPSRCGIVELASDGTVKKFVEKPSRPPSNLAFAGVLLASVGMLDTIPDSIPADIGFDVLPRLAGKMVAHPIDHYLIDIGTVENYQRAQGTWPGLEGANGNSYVQRNCV